MRTAKFIFDVVAGAAIAVILSEALHIESLLLRASLAAVIAAAFSWDDDDSQTPRAA